MTARSDPATAPLLTVSDVSKNYELHRSPGARFLRQLLGPLSPVNPRLFPAVRDVSFELFPGEAIAVLGRNGAGKSTLLQLITGLLKPSTGRIALPPRVIGLLELGSGFNPDFTGRENIWINAAILGLRREEIKAKLDEIIAFAEIGDYIDQPVRTYSSGMFLRLAFGVATAASPDLLLVDEVLAVGDIFFRQKCYDRLRVMREGGTAIVLVTHSLTDAAEFCDRGLVLSEGRMAFYGDAVEAVEYYMHHEREARTGTRAPRKELARTDGDAAQGETGEDGRPHWLDDPMSIDLSSMAQIGDPDSATVERLFITDLEGHPTRVFHQGDWVRIHASFLVHAPVKRAILGIAIRNEKNILVHGKNGLNVREDSPTDVQPGTRLELVYDVKLDVGMGEYTLDLALAEIDDLVFARRGELPPEDLAPHVIMLRVINGTGAISVITQRRGNGATFSHYGLADLPNHMTAHAFTAAKQQTVGAPSC
ncbi:ABC transporter ATP-binding protein [Azospirillum himalayense]|uniref:ABC transporter ATP-binding protein n=1 Tax=Azospirillum himalayense TaxID=654847 RepID=A0ABW0G155_9PROT